MSEQQFVAVRVAVLTISDTRTVSTDKSGELIVRRLEEAGHRVVARKIVADEMARIRDELRTWVEGAEVDVVLCTGGTGVTARDVTPEALAPLVTKSIPGFGELFRWLSYEDIGVSTIQSRAEGAVCGNALVFALPGSTGAAQLALDKILLPQLDARTRPCNFVELLPRMRERAEQA